MRILKWVREEFRRVRVVFFFFTGIFALIVVTDHIMGRGTDVLVPSFARAVVGGFIAAKVIWLVDLLPFIERYQGRPLIYSILWKALLYLVTAEIIVALEPTLRALVHEGFDAASQAVIEHFQAPRTWALTVWMTVLIFAFVALRELSRAFGHTKIKKMVLGR